MNIVFTPFGWEWRIREGELSAALLRPLHPIHDDLAGFAGWKPVVIVLWLPGRRCALARVRSRCSQPTPLECVVFFFAIWGAYLIRTMFMSLLGMITFWTTRVSAIFEIFIAAELLLSGRLVPMPLMPDWVQDVAGFLPFQWSFYFPIESLVGDLSTQELLARARHAGLLDRRGAGLDALRLAASRSGATRRWVTDARVPPRRGCTSSSGR